MKKPTRLAPKQAALTGAGPTRLQQAQLIAVSGGISCDGDEEPLENVKMSFGGRIR